MSRSVEILSMTDLKSSQKKHFAENLKNAVCRSNFQKHLILINFLSRTH